jgi:putative ABC transport system permease protein
LSALLQDLKFGFRTLWKNPGFSIIALLTIAVGIGANASIFSYIDGVLLRPLPYRDADRIVRVMDKPPQGGTNRISAAEFLDIEKQSGIFEYLAASQWNTAALTGIDEPIQVPNQRVSLHYFDVLTAETVLGRMFVAGEDQVGRDHVVLLSHVFWVNQFASDPAILGKTLTLDGDLYTVVGVLAPGTYDRTGTRIWRPLAFTKEEMGRYERRLTVWGTLKPGISIAQARAQMDALAARFAHDFPDSNKQWGLAVDPFASVLVGNDVRRSLYVLMASVGMVLLIACANLANLTLARGASREREVAIRAALGAGRWRLVRQFLTESMILSVGGSFLGLGVAYSGLAGLKRIVPGHYLPPSTYVEMDARVLGFILGLAVLTGLIFGLYPAIKASRPDLTNSLKQGGVGASVGRSGRRLRGALVVAEVALAFVLLTGAGLLIHSFFKIQQVDTGFTSSNVLTAHLPTNVRRFPTAPQLESFVRQILARLESLPGVRDVALTSAIPFEGGGWGLPFDVAGKKSADITHRPSCYFKMVSPPYFTALGMHLKRGRLLSDDDKTGTVPSIVINQTMVDRYFKNVDPVGQHLLLWQIPYGTGGNWQEIPWEIVGVVADEKIRGLSAEDDKTPGVYVSTGQCLQNYLSLVIRTAGDPRALIHSVPMAIHEVDANQTLQDLRTLDDIKESSVGDEKLQSVLLGIFASIAMLLSAIGLYGVISYSVSQRTREMGIRTALGATRRNILWLILRSGLVLTGFGLAIGFLGSLGVAQVLASMLFEIDRYDPATLVIVVSLLIAMALLACYLPARRAVRISPTVALRQD